jgi:hypothetical protein
VNFKPCSEQEIADRKLWPKGDYAFEIVEAEEKVSQQGGNPMIELKLKISRPDGLPKTMTDYLLEKTPERFRHCCEACGLLAKYESGVVSDDDFVGKRGRLRLTIEKAKKNSEYPDRNVIADYLCEPAPAKAGGASSPAGPGFFGGNGAKSR